MIRLSPPWGSSQKIKTNNFFAKIAKIIFVFIISLKHLLRKGGVLAQ